MNLIKSICFVFLLTMVGYPARSQETEPALARVHYEFFHIRDTLQSDKPIREEMVLYLGQWSTLYGSFESSRIAENLKKQVKAPGFDGHLTILTQRNTTPYSYYVQLQDRQMVQVYRNQGISYVLDEAFPSISWDIVADTKEIGGYQAQKAQGAFGGRNYQVWFTTDIPLQGGPWKLQGLPGLILEASSQDGEVRFTFAGLETDISEEAQIGIPSDAVKTTARALERLQEAIAKNPQAALSARSAGETSGGQGQVITFSDRGNRMSDIDPSSIRSITVKKDQSQVSPVVNNPLEKESNLP